MKSKNRIKQGIIFFLILFFLISFFTKITGRPNGGVMNPYYSHKSELITWEEFYSKTPKNLLASLIMTILTFTLVILGDKKPTKEEDANKNEINDTNTQ